MKNTSGAFLLFVYDDNNSVEMLEGVFFTLDGAKEAGKAAIDSYSVTDSEVVWIHAEVNALVKGISDTEWRAIIKRVPYNPNRGIIVGALGTKIH
jgi:hypothetical protein